MQEKIAFLKQQNGKPNYLIYIIGICLFLWAGLIASSFHINDGAKHISIIAAKIEFGVHAITILALISVWLKMKKEDRKVIMWLLAINLWLFMVDLFFYIAAYAHDTYLLQMSLTQFLLYYAPCMIYAVTMIIFLAKILLREVLHIRGFLKILGTLLFINIITITLFSSSIQYAFGIISWQTISQMTLLGILLVLFDLSILGLIYSNNRSISLLLSGTIILIMGDFFLTYSSISQTVSLFSYGELFWLLGLLFIMFSAISIRKNHDYDTKTWFGKSNMIKSRLAIWSLGTSIIGFLTFFVIAFAFSIIDEQVFASLPLFVMMYSIIAVILSIFMGRSFETPFKKIENNIRSLMIDDKKENVDDNFSTEEFRFLQEFILQAYDHKESQDRAKRRLGEITAQVAHDIKSPTAALLVLSQTCTDIPEEDRIALREAAHTIQDIANNVLNQYRLGDEHPIADPHKEKDLLICGLAWEILSEKRLQYKNLNVQFDYDFTPEAYFSFVKGNQTRFKRMLSNIINNAVDACNKNDGKILLLIKVSESEIFLSVRDNGKGMAPELIQKIMRAEAITTGKADGHGIGLSQVRQTLEEYHGQLQIESTLDKGTEVTLVFTRLKTPGWIADKMQLKPNTLVIILDDDKSIHTAWDHRLRDVIEHGKIEVSHFSDGQAVIDHVAGLSETDKARLFLLTDYELLKQNVNGLDVLETTKIKDSILVSSHYAVPHVLERATLLNARVLPKLLVAELPIVLNLESDLINAESSGNVDIVIVDDKPQFMNILISHYLKDKKVRLYDNPYSFLQEYARYAKSTPICLDNDLGLAELNGRILAEKLHEEGYTQLYLISGTEFNDLPAYLTPIDKGKIGDVLN